MEMLAADKIDSLEVEQDLFRQATWSIYYHAMYLPGLGNSALSQIDDRLGNGERSPRPEDTHAPQDLRTSIKVVQQASDSHGDRRRQRALRKLAAAGFANTQRRKDLIQAARQTPNVGMRNEAVGKIEEVGRAVDLLARSLDVDVAELNATPPGDAVNAIDEALLSLSTACVTMNATCESCYVPFDPVRPTTSMTARVLVKRPVAELAAVIDPRSWATCSDAFTLSNAVTYNPSQHTYDPVLATPNPGTPWTDGMLDEEVKLGKVEFRNVLNIEFDQTAPDEWTVDYSLFESRKLKMPLVDLNECVNVNEGVVIARKLLPGWTELIVEKRVRFVDLTIGTKPNPFGVDPGEILNFWAPVLLCLWLEDYTQLGPCCTP